MERTYIVSYDTADGDPVKTVTGLKNGDTVVLPEEEPHRPGYCFEGWYRDEYFDIECSEDDKIDGSDTVIYARWEEKADVPVTITVGDASKTVYVPYDTQFSQRMLPEAWEYGVSELKWNCCEEGTPITAPLKVTATAVPDIGNLYVMLVDRTDSHIAVIRNDAEVSLEGTVMIACYSNSGQMLSCRSENVKIKANGEKTVPLNETDDTDNIKVFLVADEGFTPLCVCRGDDNPMADT